MKTAFLLNVYFLISLYCCSCAIGTEARSSMTICFDEVPGVNDIEKLKNLPDLISSKVVDFGTRYSQGGNYPQPGETSTMVKVLFSPRVHDFLGLTEPVDMGDSFEFSGEGMAIFECGKDGFIRFSQYQATFKNISFLGPKGNLPPLLVYNGTCEHRQWRPLSDEEKKVYVESMRLYAAGHKEASRTIFAESGVVRIAKLKKGERARGIHQDAGRIIIDNCSFKGFGVCIRTRMGHAIDPGEIIMTNTRFFHIVQIADWLMFDHIVITRCWICPSIESDRAVLVSVGGMYFHDNLLVPLSTKGPFRNCRWFDNYGWGLTIKDNRFENENINWYNVLSGEQIAIVYNYKGYGKDWVNAQKSWELTGDRFYIIIQDNLLYCRNMPVVTYFEIPNMTTITGNCGGDGQYKTLKDTVWNDKPCPKGSVIDTTCWCDFKCQMPNLEDCKYVSFEITNNLRAINVTRKNPDLLAWSSESL